MAPSDARLAHAAATTAADPLPVELGTALLTLATSAVPISLVSRLARHLAAALSGRRLADAEVVVLAAMLARAAGPWLPTRHRFASLMRQLEGLLSSAGCGCADVQAVLADLEEAFRLRLSRPSRI